MKRYLSCFLIVILFSFNFNIEIFAKDIEIEGFVKRKSEYVSDYNIVADTYEHIKTGAKVLVIDNGDDEKFFTIGFKTPPENNKGTAHVFEHMVLQGSQKYPVKSMLSQIAATSCATYFNAVTSDDFTFYPFGSRNEKDFYNLMNIYLDGIFSPMLLTEEKVFERDGIRIDTFETTTEYNGVVYNEMKNSSMQPENILYNSIKKSLYPDTYYKYISGGNPEDIVDLSYEEVLEFYEKNYHPSNSLTILYGNQDLQKSLELLNSYFKNYKRKESISAAYQKPFEKMMEYYGTYPSNEDDVIMSINYVIPQEHSYEDLLLDLITVEVLMSTSEVLQNLQVTTNYTQVNQGAISFYDFCEREDKENFEERIENGIETIYNEGVEQQYIDAILSNLEYINKTADNKGYEAGYKAISGWVYNDNPTLMLDDTAIIENISKRIDSSTIQENIKELFLENNYKSLVILEPDENYEVKQLNIVKEKLVDIIKNSDIQKLKEKTEKFYNWQNESETQEVLDTIPKLTLDDLSEENISIDYSQPLEVGKAKLIQTYIDTEDISNIVLSFSMENMPQESLQYVSLLSKIWGFQKTKNYSKEKLSIELIKNFGEFSTFTEVLNNSARLNINLKTLNSKEKTALKLLEEIMFYTDLNDKEGISLILNNLKQIYEKELTDINSSINLNLASAMTSESGKLRDYLEGYSFYKFVDNLCKKIDNDWEDISNNLEKSKNFILNQEKLVIGYTAPKNKTNKFIKNIKNLVQKIPVIDGVRQIYSFDDYDSTVVIPTQSTTFGIIQTENIRNIGYYYRNDMKVLSAVISKEYLWKEIREKGGAYHTGLSINGDGLVKIISYAVPDLNNAMKVYDGIGGFLQNIEDMDKSKFESYLISINGSIDNNLQKKNLWNYGINNYLKNFSLENVYKAKQDILNTELSDIKKYCEMFEKIKENPKYIIIMNEKLINKN